WTRSRSAALGLESIHPFVARPLHPLVPGLSRHPEPFAVPDERRLATRREPGLHELLPEQPRERLLGHPPNVDDRCAQTPRNQSVAARQIATLPAPRVSPRLPVRRVQKVPGLYRLWNFCGRASQDPRAARAPRRRPAQAPRPSRRAARAATE